MAPSAVAGNIPTWGEHGGGMSGGLDWLGELPMLEEALLWRNSFSGTLPTTMRGMSRLRDLQLGDNPLHTEFPEWIGELPNLTDINMIASNLIGTLPATLGGTGNGKLRRVLLRSNRISGTLTPGMFGRLVGLHELGLTTNMLSGTIPPCVSEATELRELSLSANRMEGELPPSISRMPRLHTLHLQYNDGMTKIDIGMERPEMLSTCSFQDCGWICPVPDWSSAPWFEDGCSATCTAGPRNAHDGHGNASAVEA